jgi:hypothetical protein
MPVPTSSIYFMLNSSAEDSNGMYALSVTAPTTTFLNNSSGWIVGTIAATGYQLMDFQSEVARTVFQVTPYSGSPNSSSNAGDCMRTPLLKGEIPLSASVEITQSVKANTAGGAMDGRFIYRFWKGANPTGHQATLISNTFFSSSTVLNLATTATQVCFASIPLPLSRFDDEYLFVQVQWQITGAGGGTTADCNLWVGPTSQSTVKLTAFQPYLSNPQIFNFEEFPAP